MARYVPLMKVVAYSFGSNIIWISDKLGATR